ncbi:MAG: hypothetical protein OEZ02_14880 [Anaerolineae bacterium]|nr:hypothetical protein [Anaerolineae bacterium]
MNKPKLLTGFWALILITSACSTANNQPQTDTGCYPPAYELAYPYKKGKDIWPRDPSPLPLSESWMPQLSKKEQNDSIYHRVYSIVARNDDEIWTVDQENLIRYTPTTREIKRYTIKTLEGGEILPYALYVTADNTLWALGDRRVAGEIAPVLYLSRLNDELDQFEIIVDEGGVFFNEQGYSTYNQILEDKKGMLWMIFSEKLFRYDPKTNQAEIVVGVEQGIYLKNSLALSPSGEMWFTGLRVDEVKDKRMTAGLRIFRYNPLTEEVQDFFGPPNYKKIVMSNLFFDHRGRLWVDDYGWVEIPKKGYGQWYEIIRSPIFIAYSRDGDYGYGWARPSPKLETPDHQIWFPFGNGLAKLDLNTNQWCLLSTLQIFDIAQDSSNNLWVAAEGQLYKYDPDN